MGRVQATTGRFDTPNPARLLGYLFVSDWLTGQTVCRYRGHLEAKSLLHIEGCINMSDKYTVYWHMSCLRCGAVRTRTKEVPSIQPTPEH